tara:strand:- start:3580 stop:3846 length:267 start_codon:yes stop_codon:yes gene_type:complete
MVRRRNSDNGPSGTERAPGFAELAKVRDLHHRHNKTNPFLEMRKECDELELTLERAGKGYFLSGRDLPVSGVHCRNLYEVEEELRNYG